MDGEKVNRETAEEQSEADEEVKRKKRDQSDFFLKETLKQESKSNKSGATEGKANNRDKSTPFFIPAEEKS